MKSSKKFKPKKGDQIIVCTNSDISFTLTKGNITTTLHGTGIEFTISAAFYKRLLKKTF